ncbi:MAG TPA: cation diffusion facilitator family transporter [Anaerolineaceae bacterium]|nr:cation diffusion facilitator family transporter [Anaerolineaceae bacterium]
MQWVRDYQPQPDQNRMYRQALWITLGGNVVLAVVKALAAYLSGSVALLADAANSVSDVAYSLMMVLGLSMALRPPDLSHPQGHSRFEPLVGMAVTFSMAFAGYTAARESIDRFISGGAVVDLGIPALVLFGSAAVKAGMFLYIRRIADRLGSPTLRTTAMDHISDVLTSLAAFFGVLGSQVLSPLADPIAGLLVAFWIFRAAFNAGKENLGYLTGAAAPKELTDEIIRITENVPGVIRVHHLMTEYVGPTLVVDMHINVNGSLPLRETHAISDRVTEALQELPEVDRAYVHVEPEDWHD